MESPKVRRGRAAPFYQTSDKVQTSAQIISEARTAIKHGSLRAVPTRRPETPQEKQRILFGDQSAYDSVNRPPSSFSIGSRPYESESRPVSGKQRLSPLDHKPRLSIAEEDVSISPKPPTDPNRPHRYSAGKSRALQHSTSVEPTAVRQLDQYSPDDDSSIAGQRRVHSGPKERTPRFMEGADAAAFGEEPVSVRRAASGGQTRRVTRPSSLDMSDQLAEMHVGPAAGGSKYISALSPVSPDGDSSAHSLRTASNSDTDSPSRGSLVDQAPQDKSVVQSGEGDSAQHKGKKVKASERPSSQEVKDTRQKRSSSHTQKSAARDTGSAGRHQSGMAEESPDSRLGSAGRRDEESEEERQLYDTVLSPILQQMAVCRAPTDEASTTQLIVLSDQLFKVMSQYNLLGKNCKRRSAVLKVLFKLLDSDVPQLLVKLATLILSLKVSGNNLVNVSKLVLMVCKTPSNDDILLQNNIPDLLLDVVETSEVSSSLDAFVYLIGAIKFLSSNPVIVKRLVKRRLVRILGSVIQRVNKLKSRNVNLNEQLVGPVLVQVTAALRNSADVQGVWNQFLESQLISELSSVLSAYVHDYDLALNVARIFSKLSGHAECCRVLSSQPSHFSVCLALLSTHLAKEDLVVRVAFVLGNVTARDETSRQNLVSQPSHLDVLLNVLRYYVDCDKQSSRHDDKYEDVLVKVVRVIANLSISEHVGPHIAASERCIDLLQYILDKKELASSEELILNTITAINNLSYFDINSSAVTKAQLSLAKGLIRYVDESHIEGLCEATRVLGNLSRTRTVRELLMQFAIGEKLVRMLSSSQSEVVYTSCGVLINLMLDEDKRFLLRKDDNKGISLLLEALRDFAHADWLLATLVCQVLWNYCSRADNVSQWLGWQQAQQLAALLDDCLDEESAVTRSEVSEEGEKEMEEYVLEQWRSEFCPVATALLTKLESSLPDLEPLQANSRPG